MDFVLKQFCSLWAQYNWPHCWVLGSGILQGDLKPPPQNRAFPPPFLVIYFKIFWSFAWIILCSVKTQAHCTRPLEISQKKETFETRHFPWLPGLMLWSARRKHKCTNPANCRHDLNRTISLQPLQQAVPEERKGVHSSKSKKGHIGNLQESTPPFRRDPFCSCQMTHCV